MATLPSQHLNGGLGYRRFAEKSSRCSNFSSDGLLPELWLTESENARGSEPAPYPAGHVPDFSDHSPLSAPAYLPDHAAFPNYFHAGACRPDWDQPRSQEHFSGPQFHQLHSTFLLREQSLEYAQSLLPHSLFPEEVESVEEHFAPLSHDHHPLTQANLKQNQMSPSDNYKMSPSDNYKMSPSDNYKTSPLVRHCSRNDSVSSQSSSSSNSSKSKHLNTQLYKTELCASFIKSGACPYGSKCQFAHGKHELKVVDRPSNWRSKPCANWSQFGSCRYGKRCCFKHEP